MSASPNRPVPYRNPHSSADNASDSLAAAESFRFALASRRSVRLFDPARPVSEDLVRTLIAAATSAPSGANKQPWRFVAVNDPAIKREIRVAAEAEEREFYTRRASQRWLEDLAVLGTDEHKPFLEEAPWLIVLFKLMRDDDGGQVYYVDESVGIAAGFFIAAVHLAGLVTLTHTPSPMKFLSRILNRPAHERPYLLLPLGYPAPDCTVPHIRRKTLDQVFVLNRQ